MTEGGGVPVRARKRGGDPAPVIVQDAEKRGGTVAPSVWAWAAIFGSMYKNGKWLDFRIAGQKSTKTSRKILRTMRTALEK